MATTVTGLQILQKVLQRGGLGFYIPNADIDSLSTSAVTSVQWLRNANWDTNHFSDENYIIFRPAAASAADYIRYADIGGLTVATGALAPDTTWADGSLGTEDFYLLRYGIRPQLIVQAMQRALERCYFSTSEPLCVKPTSTTVSDAGFQASGTSSWTVGATGTFTKVSTTDSENVFPGRISAGRFVCSAAGDYIYQRFAVEAYDTVNVFALSRLSSGTNAQLITRDVENAAAIGSTVSHSEKAWQWMVQRGVNIPSGCKTLEVRLGGEGSSDDAYWNALCVYRMRDNYMILDSTWENNGFRLPALYSAMFTGVSPDTNVFAGFGMQLVEIPKADYQFEFSRPGANPSGIIWNNHDWFNYPIFIQGRRAYSDLTTFTLPLTETTACDINLVEAATRVELFSDPEVARRVPDVDTRLAQAFGAFLEAEKQEEQAGPADRRPVFVYPRLRN